VSCTAIATVELLDVLMVRPARRILQRVSLGPWARPSPRPSACGLYYTLPQVRLAKEKIQMLLASGSITIYPCV
jgi:hypothetical protein